MKKNCFRVVAKKHDPVVHFLEQFQNYVSEKKLFSSGDIVLLGVSGGIDSAVMCELFHLVKYKFAIAHCNFQLRGKESEEDEKFVKHLAKKYKVKFYSKKFRTSEYAANKGISLQMSARELRYGWFEKIRKENAYDFISVATHLDDEIETVLLNFTRGTGIAGLHGILPKKEKVIRPLLFASRREIQKFCKKHKLQFREDSSNVSKKYIRNKIRHKVIPVLKEINPKLEKTIAQNIERIRDAEEIFYQRIEEKKKEIFIYEKDKIKIPVNKLLQLSPLKTYLFEFLKPFGFNETVIEEIISALQKQPGKKFFSGTHSLLKDRKELALVKTSKKKHTEVFISKSAGGIEFPVSLKFKVVSSEKHKIIWSENIAQLDYDKLQFPLKLRQWNAGDFFIPLGMRGRKKISDFLVDEKIPFTEKENIFVLTSGGKIAWVAGKRIDDRFKVCKTTTKIFIAEPA